MTVPAFEILTLERFLDFAANLLLDPLVYHHASRLLGHS